MSKIFIGRSDQQLGQFTEEEVFAGLRSGRFSFADLWWKEGMEKWEPLSVFPNVEAPRLAPPLVANETLDGAFPWENESLGIFERFWQTCVGVLFNPWKTFEKMSVSGGYGKPLLYGVICLGFVAIAATILVGVMLFFQPPEDNEVPLWFIPCFGAIIAVYGMVGFFFRTVILHLFLMLFGVACRSFEATFHAVTYSNAPVFVLRCVPCLNIFVALWGIVVEIIALKEAHRTDYWRVICACLLPLFLCIGLVVTFYGAIALAAITTHQS